MKFFILFSDFSLKTGILMYNIKVMSDARENKKFIEVSLSDFYDAEPEVARVQDEGIVILTPKEKILYNQFIPNGKSSGAP